MVHNGVNNGWQWFIMVDSGGDNWVNVVKTIDSGVDTMVNMYLYIYG